MTDLKVFKCRENAELPHRATEGSSCFDISAALTVGERIRTYNPWNKECMIPVKNIGGKIGFQLHPENRALVPTGLIFDIPDNYVLKMFIRSGTALKKGLVLANGVGIIDSDYVEESYIMVYNISDSLVVINAGERLAQVALEKVCLYTLSETKDKPTQKTSRDSGFGSTGVIGDTREFLTE
jgi:dUTP pyrophosphatase